MKAQYFICFFFLCSCFYGCSKDDMFKDDSKMKSAIDIGGISKVLLEDLIYDVEFISLELNDKSGMSLGTKISIKNDKFYILDPSVNAIFVFDFYGNFIGKIGNKGDDPSQVNLVVDFAFNEVTGMVEILSPTGKIVAYDEDTKKYSSVMSSNSELLPVYGFANLTEDIIVFYSNLKEYLVYYYSRSQKRVLGKYILNEAIESIDWHSIHPFTNDGQKLSLLDMYSSKVYSLDSSGATVKYHYVFGENDVGINSSTHEEILATGDLIDYLVEKKSFYPISFHFEDENIKVLRGLFSGSRRKELVYRKKSKSWSITDVTSVGDFYLCKAGLGNGRYVGIQNLPIDLEKQFPSKVWAADQQAIVDNIKEDGNPVLISYKLK